MLQGLTDQMVQGKGLGEMLREINTSLLYVKIDPTISGAPNKQNTLPENIRLAQKFIQVLL